MNIKEFKNKYKGQRCVFLASGESHLQYKDNDEYIVFGMNYIFEKHKLDYLFISEFETFNIIRKHFDERKIIIPNLTGLNKHRTPIRIKVKGNFIEYQIQDPLIKEKKDLPNFYYGDDESKGFVTYTTTTQSAIHVLCYMGFKQIDVYGVDYKKYSNGKVHFESKLSKDYREQLWSVFSRFKEGDDYIFPRLSKEFNCKIINKGLL